MNAPLKLDPGILTWTPDRVALLRRHYTAGLSAAESAILLGGVTKNAVISKRNRLGLVGQVRMTTAQDGSVSLRHVRTRALRLNLHREPKFSSTPLPAMDGAPPEGADPKPLVAHRRGECLWPLGPAEQEGDWRTLFCCAPVAGGRRYCPTHARRARP